MFGPRFDWLWIVLAAGLIFFVRLGAPALFDEDEPQHAGCAVEMHQGGQWVVPTLNGRPFPDKPALMFWLMIVGFELFGVNELSARFFSAVLATATCLIVYRMGTLLLGRRAGFWAGLILCSTIIFTVSARAATVDSALTLLTTLAMLAFLARGVGRGEDGSTEAGAPGGRPWFLPAGWRSYAAMYAALGAAVLAKGPVGAVLPMTAIGLFLLLMNDRRAGIVAGTRRVPKSPPHTACAGYSDSRFRKWLAAAGGVLWAALRLFRPSNFLKSLWQMRPLTGLLVIGAVAGPWYVLVGLRTDGRWLVEFFGVHNFGRALGVMHNHWGPFVLYYILVILIGFFPWSVFIGPMIDQAARRLGRDSRQGAAYLFLICWVGVFVLFWSCVSTKFPHYVLPAYPALALLAGALVDRLLAEPATARRLSAASPLPLAGEGPGVRAAGIEISRSSAWMRDALITWAVVGVGMVIALPIVAAYVMPGEGVLGLVGMILVAGAAVGWLFWRRGRIDCALRAMGVAAVLFVAAIFTWAAIRVDRHQNARPLVAAIEEDSRGDAEILAYRYLKQSFVYYAGRPIPMARDAEELRTLLAAAKQPYVITLGRYEAEIEQALPGRLSVLARMPRFSKPAEDVVVLKLGSVAKTATDASVRR